MDERRIRRTALAALGVVAVVVLANAAVSLFEQSYGDDAPPAVQPPTSTASAPVTSNLEFPHETILLVVLSVGLIGIALQFVREPREALKKGLVAGAFLVVMTVIARNFSYTPVFSPPQHPEEVRPQFSGETLTKSPGGFEQGASESLPLPVEFVLLVLLVAGAVGVVYLRRSSSLEFPFRSDEDGDGALEAGPGEFGRVAGDAADRVDAAATAAAADNAIYRAWVEMVDLLGESDPQSATPRQFESAAIEAGMDPDDVAILTRTFEEVRYGDVSLSEERRERVTAAFRRIESDHGRAAGDPASAGPGEDRRDARGVRDG